MENDPVKILITYGEAIELKNAGIFEDFYQCFSHLKIPDNEDPYSLGFGLSFDRDWICQLFKKNHFKDFAVIACVMTEIILPHVNNMISPPIKPNELEQIIDIEYKHLERNFKQWLKNKEIEKIIQRFCIPTPLFYPKSKLKYGSFFFWIDYICSIRDKGYNILENEAKKGNDVCLKIALIEFGNQDNNRLSAEWEGLIKTRFPKLEFYLSKIGRAHV